jgi:hypothetical protein
MTRPNRILSAAALAMALGTLALVVPSLEAQSGTDVQQAVEAAHATFRTLKAGQS